MLSVEFDVSKVGSEYFGFKINFPSCTEITRSEVLQ